MQDIAERIFSIQTPAEFETCALEVFKHQYQHNKVYRKFCDLLGRTHPKNIEEIPFLPISFFKTERVVCDYVQTQKVFKSSGTTGMVRSEHHVHDLSLYETSFMKAYTSFLGDVKDHVVIALLPSYVAQGESSLLYMVDHLIQASGNESSGYFLDDIAHLENHISKIRTEQPKKRVVLFGVSYALLDFADLKPNLEGCVVIETGGMKGRRKEMLKEELHDVLSKAFNIPVISSEYGMTELLSQAYSVEEQIFKSPPWMDVRIRAVSDALSFNKKGKTGGVNVIDLANLHSCSFIATQDLGKRVEGGFKILGRFENSDIRGCNLLVQ
ncbi:Acyl-protein synthetase, LuxE [Lishizhenia tianjinensis]|uniref:Acyl-protein synthetase, LuxE n=1 Tax=Lishizhenia tianjinensis TaxID=477690 RepID=A0A1I6ZZQ2_9FLAO|nr:acyl transferase [Lishizhenia tianjinensis]SFT68139.1 Acyl-protein synthetase, LuxE [Lishizhenia tianjinensis]